MAGRPKIFEEQAVIDQATNLFWQRGYEATSTEALLAAMGIGKGSFYLSFKGGKRELFEKTLDQFNQRALQRFCNELNESSQPVEYIRNFFRKVATAPSEVHQNGCYLGNTIAEAASTDRLLMEKAAHLLKQLESLFEEVIRAAQREGQLVTQEDPALLARYLLTVWNGLNITRRMYPEAAVLTPLIEMQLKPLQ
jgi:TetR/AcrR family transcriptional repressor of nem operon